MYGAALESVAIDDDGRHTATSVALDSEKFAFANAHHAIVVRTHSPAYAHLELAVRMMACRSDKGPVSVGHSRVDW